MSGQDKLGVTAAEALGQAVWLLSQSQAHRALRVADVEAVFLPAIMAQQFRLFRMGEGSLAEAVVQGELQARQASGLETTPLGIAIWAQLSEAAEERLQSGERLLRDDWKSGDRLWLIELIVPFHSPENRLQDIALLDLLNGPFAGREVKLHQIDPSSGNRRTVTVPPQRASTKADA